MNLLALGTNKLDHSEDVLRTKIRQSLQFLGPHQVISDYSYGWNLLVAEVAQEFGISVIGAIPYAEVPAILPPIYIQRRQMAERKARANTIFNQTASKFVMNVQTYVDWITEFSNEVIAYFPPEASSFSYSLMVILEKKDKHTFNLYGGL